MSFSDARLSAARAAIAAACLENLPSAALGSVQLRDDQRRIVARATRALAREGGCLIGEDVGRGKTYVALALARHWRHPLVIAPASLRSTWRAATERAQVSCAFVSHEALSRGFEPDECTSFATLRTTTSGAIEPFDGIIVDESHHFRTPNTRRYAALTRLAARAPIVLLSATPLQNRARDLSAQIALFHGERAFSLDTDALARFVIRGDDALDVGMPTVVAPEWLTIDADDGEVLRAILDLPAPARPLDGGDAGALRTIGLVRAWASSRAALQSALRSRRRLATAIAQGVDEGRTPTRREARAWFAAEDVVQLGFPAILMRGTSPTHALADLRVALDRDAEAVEQLVAVLRATRNPDDARVEAIRRLRQQHANTRIIAFSEYSSTVSALFAAMRDDARVGMLSAREARIASGRIPRDELLARFAPVAQHATPWPAHDSVTLLLSTDLLSEGVNLQDAGIVLHLDLPWNPARLAQRVGRLRRPGGPSDVRAYLLAPPANAEALLDAETRLRCKLAVAKRAIGTGFQVIPALTESATSAVDAHSDNPEIDASAASVGAFMDRLARWSRPASSRAWRSDRCSVAAVHAPLVGCIAALSDGRVVTVHDGLTSDALSIARRLAEFAEGQSRPPDPSEVRAALVALNSWLDAEQLAATCGIVEQHGPMRRAVLDWLGLVARSLRRHEHATTFPLVGQLRDALRYPFALGTERLLASFAARPRERGGVVAALEGMVRLVEESRVRIVRVPADDARRPHVVGLICFG
ncbi:MAG: helicase-related protein [bacterium]